MPTLVQPFSLRSKVSRESGDLRISIPMKRSWVILFILVWLTFWTYGGFDTGRKLLHQFDVGAFIWMCFWAFAECGAVYVILRMLFGQDVVAATPSEFHLSKQIFGIGYTRAYLVQEMRDLRFQPEVGSARSRRASRIAFDYGAKTISFAPEIDEAEAAELIVLIKNQCNIRQSPSAVESGIKFWQQD